MTQPNTSVSHSRFYLFMFLAILLLILGFTVKMVGPYLLSILMGGLIALLLSPFHKRLLKHRCKPALSAGVITLSAIILVIGPLFGFLSRAIQQGILFVSRFGESSDFVNNLMQKIVEWSPLSMIFGSPEAVESQVQIALKSLAAWGSTTLFSMVSDLPLIILQIALTLLSAYFFLVDGSRFVKWTSDKVPLEPDVRKKVYSTFRDTAIASVWATLAASLAQAGVVVIGFLATGIPNVFLAGGVTFICAWIPLVGSTPIWVSGCIYLLVKDQTGAAVVMAAFGLTASIIDNLVRPVVLKGRSDMHPLVSLVAVFGGLKVFGIFGVFLGPVTMGVLIALLEIWPLVASRLGLDLKKNT